MIDRNDMLELTRRLTPARSSVDRIAEPGLMKRDMWKEPLIRISST